MGWRGVVARLMVISLVLGGIIVLALLTSVHFALLAVGMLLVLTLASLVFFICVDTIIDWWDR